MICVNSISFAILQFVTLDSNYTNTRRIDILSFPHTVPSDMTPNHTKYKICIWQNPCGTRSSLRYITITVNNHFIIIWPNILDLCVCMPFCFYPSRFFFSTSFVRWKFIFGYAKKKPARKGSKFHFTTIDELNRTHDYRYYYYWRFNVTF